VLLFQQRPNVNITLLLLFAISTFSSFVFQNVRKSIQDSTETEYRSMMTTNVDSCFFLSKGLYPLLLKAAQKTADSFAAVVNVSSTAGVTSTGTGAIYAMTKAAMVQLSKVQKTTPTPRFKHQHKHTKSNKT
jgi:NAD(P)-dependent dehydrogenase (short-subunit alcohol dehydrogenase family)